MEAYANIPEENLFNDDLFFKYVGWSKVNLGNMLGLYDFTMPGGIKLNHGNLISQGQAEVKKLKKK
jgi:hypothetical protein